MVAHESHLFRRLSFRMLLVNYCLADQAWLDAPRCLLCFCFLSLFFFYRSPKASGASASMAALEARLEKETFLAGQRVTLADIAVCCRMVGQSEGATPAVARWMGTCLNQPHFK